MWGIAGHPYAPGLGPNNILDRVSKATIRQKPISSRQRLPEPRPSKRKKDNRYGRNSEQ